VYLLLGAVGIFGSLGKIKFVTGKFERLDLIGPMILIAALAIRLVKTRAEIGGGIRSSDSSSHRSPRQSLQFGVECLHLLEGEAARTLAIHRLKEIVYRLIRRKDAPVNFRKKLYPEFYLACCDLLFWQ
jgi:hypothetical protein